MIEALLAAVRKRRARFGIAMAVDDALKKRLDTRPRKRLANIEAMEVECRAFDHGDKGCLAFLVNSNGFPPLPPPREIPLRAEEVWFGILPEAVKDGLIHIAAAVLG